MEVYSGNLYASSIQVSFKEAPRLAHAGQSDSVFAKGPPLIPSSYLVHALSFLHCSFAQISGVDDPEER